MEVLYPRCAGLDVHQQTVVACARVASGPTVQQEVRTFGTTTGDLLALADWLTTHGCTHVAMESTGVYLEADLARARRPLRADSRERPPDSERAGSQKRRE